MVNNYLTRERHCRSIVPTTTRRPSIFIFFTSLLTINVVFKLCHQLMIVAAPAVVALFVERAEGIHEVIYLIHHVLANSASF